MTTAWTAGAWGRRAVNADRLARAARTRRYGRLAAGGAAVLAVVAGAWTAGADSGPPLIAASGAVALWRTASGLAVSMPFDRPLAVRDLLDPFKFDGSARQGVGYELLGPTGLLIGVRRHPARFEGWFAVTRRAYPAAGIYHVQMTKPAGSVSTRGAQGETVFAVQTGTTKQNGLINYVIVATSSRQGGTKLDIGYAHGHVANARLDTLARLSDTAGRTLSITLTTDGRHRLAVWIGARLVYRSSRLHFDIAPPFQPYLEVQSRTVAYTATFHDLWVTTSSVLSVTAPTGAHVRLVGHGGSTISRAVAQNGSARLTLPPPLARGRASLVVQLGARRVTLGPFPYAGGDHLRITGIPGASPPATSTTGSR